MNATLEQISALYRYFIWAESMRVHYHQVLATREEQAGTGNPPSMEATVFTHPYMSYWFAGTFVVIEGWRDLGLSGLEIDRLLTSSLVEALQRYRNGAFHFQRKYFDARFTEFIGAGKESSVWINEVRNAFHRWFSAYIEALNRS